MRICIIHCVRVAIPHCDARPETPSQRDCSRWHGNCLLKTMKLALSVWNDRIAPVFDASERCLIVDADSSGSIGDLVGFPGWSAADKARFLAEKGVSTVVCGAVSHEYEEAFISRGIEIISFIAGPVEQVIEAWNDGTLIGAPFSMPGCGCPRRRRCRRRGRGGSLNL